MKKRNALARFNPNTAKKFLAVTARRSKRVRIESAGEYQSSWTTILAIDDFLASPFIKGETEQKARLWAAYKHTSEQLDTFVKTAKGHKAAILAARVAYMTKVNARAELVRVQQEKQLRKRAIADAKVLAKALRREGAHKQAKAIMAAARTGPLTAAPNRLVDKSAGSVHSMKFDFRIDHPEMVPDKYWKIDPKLIRRDVKAFGSTASIPGVTILIIPREHSRKVKP